ncbi:ParB family chromosome partitioning protein [Nocardia sp. GP40]|uniref:hypothetical protein n=1 Tax=Nocardia sp. GP40 TaxID=3156268 RepID=UPI003D1BB23E
MTTTEAPTPAATDTPVEGRKRHPAPLSAEQIAELTAALEATQTKRLSIEPDPDDLVFGRNIRQRAELTLDPEFLADIAENGFETSPVAWINPQGFLQVKTGHRRTLAARAVDYRPCPVTLVPPPRGKDAQEQRFDEIGSQWGENKHRLEMTEADELGAIQEMLDLGATPAAVHKRLKTVSTQDAAAVARMSKARAAAAAQAATVAGDLDLVQAATAAELEPTAKEMQRLIQAAAAGYFNRTVIEIRRERRAAVELRKARATFAKKGYTLLERKPGYYDEDKPTALEDLETPGGRKATVADVVSPGDWAVLLGYEEQPVRIDTGEQVEVDDIDIATYLDPDATPAEGKIHANAVHFTPSIVPRYWCTDRKHAKLKVAKKGDGTSRKQADAAAISRKANEAARTDTEARREYVRDKILKREVDKGLTRKPLPKGIIQWVTQRVLTDPGSFTKERAREIAAEWFDLGEGTGAISKLPEILGYDEQAAADAQKASDQRATLILAALAMAAAEAWMQPNEKQPHYWRILQDRPNVHYIGDKTGHARYLRVLVAAGHKPGPIERALLGQITLTDALAEAEARAKAAKATT